jgi:hypothetical protein
MEKVGECASVADASIDEVTRVAQVLGVKLAFLSEHIECDLRRGQILPEAIVKLAGNPATFLILHSKQLYGKAAKRRRALLHEGFQRIVRAAESFLGGCALLQVIANFILASSCDQRRAHGAD